MLFFSSNHIGKSGLIRRRLESGPTILRLSYLYVGSPSPSRHCHVGVPRRCSCKPRFTRLTQSMQRRTNHAGARPAYRALRGVAHYHARGFLADRSWGWFPTRPHHRASRPGLSEIGDSPRRLRRSGSGHRVRTQVWQAVERGQVESR